jgi:Ca-activated chloride channel homolog
MRVAGFPTLAVAFIVSMAVFAETPTLRITSPEPGAIVSGPTRLEALIAPPHEVESVSFFVNGRLACSAEQPPFGCTWEAGDFVRGHHVRVVATLAGGGRLVANVRTKDLGYTERARVDAVLVPVIVTARGQFVRGLTRQDFEVFEDGVPQRIATLASEDAPLDLVLAIDISGSMEHALEEVKVAVTQLLSKLRPGDAATLVAFNDTTFIVAERETDQRAREAAVELLASWGGTALYDATVRALGRVTRERGRKGVILFSDGDDQHSLTSREAAMARVQASEAMLYTVGFGAGATLPRLRRSLEEYARSTGGRAFFPRDATQLDAVFDEIVEELGNQYMLTYSPKNLEQDGRWRDIKVQVRKGKYDVRARQGYRAVEPQRAER